jgi:hypothetical protein
MKRIVTFHTDGRMTVETEAEDKVVEVSLEKVLEIDPAFAELSPIALRKLAFLLTGGDLSLSFIPNERPIPTAPLQPRPRPPLLRPKRQRQRTTAATKAAK